MAKVKAKIDTDTPDNETAALALLADLNAEAAKAIADANTIECDGPEYKTLAGETIGKLTIKSISFRKWSNAYARAETKCQIKKDWSTFGVELRQELIKERLVAHAVAGGELALTDMDIQSMPRKYAARVLNAVVGDANTGKSRVVVEGNGVDTPTIIELGTPLKIITGKDKTETEIKELEISAESMSKIAHVVCAFGEYNQTFALLKHCAKPIGIENLSRLNDTLLDQITPEDGFFIMQKVLPAFLD